MVRAVVVSDRAQRDLAELDPKVARRILDALDHYATTGDADLKKLRGRADLWRLRVGDWHVIVALGPGTIDVARILNRRDAYR